MRVNETRVCNWVSDILKWTPKKKRKEDESAVGFVGCRFTASFRFSEIANHICSRCWVKKARRNIFFVYLFVSCWISCVCVCVCEWMSTLFFDIASIILSVFVQCAWVGKSCIWHSNISFCYWHLCLCLYHLLMTKD